MLLLSAGDYSADPGIVSGYRSRFIASTMVYLGYDAVALGERELERGIRAIKEDSAAGVPLLCGNVYENGTRILPEYKIVEIGKTKIGIFSLLGSAPRELRSLEIRDPLSEGRSILQMLKKKADYVILIAHMDRGKLDSIMDGMRGVDLVIRGHSLAQDDAGSDCADSSSVFFEKTSVPILFSGWGARSIGAAVVDPEERQSASLKSRWLVSLDESVPEDPELLSRIRAFVSDESAMLRQLELSKNLSRDRRTGRIVERYLGMDVCARCHGDLLPAFTLSRHFRAIESLKTRGEASNSSCLACHTTGFGRETGYSLDGEEKGAPYLQGVQCEACHGPGTMHERGGSYRASASNSCKSCHTAKWSPDFEFERYWKRIAHRKVSVDSLGAEAK